MTAFVIPNAILISTLHAKHFFASFLSRDTVHELLTKLWRYSRPGLTLTPSFTESEYPNGRESETEMDADEDDDNEKESTEASESSEGNQTRRKKFKLPKLSIKNVIGDHENERNHENEGSQSLPTTPNSPESFQKSTMSTGETLRQRSKSETGLDVNSIDVNQPISLEPPEKVPVRPRVSSKPQKLTKINTHVPKRTSLQTVCACLKNKEHYNNVALDTKFTGSVEKIYNLLFTSGFVRKFLMEHEKCTDINIGEWVPEPNRLLTRTSSYIKPLNHSIGPKSTKCYLKDECLHRDFNSYVTNITTTTTPEVPSGGCFSVKTRTCIMWAGPNETRVIITCTVEFTKSSWLKGVIEKASIDGQQLYQKNLATAIRKYIVAHPTEFQDEVGSPVRELSEMTPDTTLDADEPRVSSRSLSVEDDVGLDEEEQEKSSIVQTLFDVFDALSTIFSLENFRIPSVNTLIIFAFVFMVVANGYIWSRLMELTQKLENIQNETDPGPFAKSGLGVWRPGDLLYESQRLRELASIFDDHINTEGDLLWDWINEKAKSYSASDTDNANDEKSDQYKNEHFSAGPRFRRTLPLYDLVGQIEDLHRLVAAAENHAKRLVDIAEEERAHFHQRIDDQLSKDSDQKVENDEL